MLTELFVDNYKSLVNTTVHPHELNLLVGMNNVGKSNFCQAMRFLAGTASLPLSDCVNGLAFGPTQLTNWYSDSNDVEFRIKAELPWEEGRLPFEYSLRLGPVPEANGPRPVVYEVKNERLSVRDESAGETFLLQNESGTVRVLRENPDASSQRPPTVAMGAPRDGTALFRLYDLPETPRINLFRQYIHSWRYYDFCVSALRSASHQPGHLIVNTHGENLASVIYQLKTANERAYRELLDPLRSVEPGIEVINFLASPDNKNVFMFFENSARKQLPAVQASAGTLRFLAMLCALLPTTPTLPAFSPFVIIEEPENGLHVTLLIQLLEIARESPLRPQVLFTSHAPYFIDLFDDRLESVLVLEIAEGRTRIEPLNAAKAESRLENMSLGEQHFQGLLQ